MYRGRELVTMVLPTRDLIEKLRRDIPTHRDVIDVHAATETALSWWAMMYDKQMSTGYRLTHTLEDCPSNMVDDIVSSSINDFRFDRLSVDEQEIVYCYGCTLSLIIQTFFDQLFSKLEAHRFQCQELEIKRWLSDDLVVEIAYV